MQEKEGPDPVLTQLHHILGSQTNIYHSLKNTLDRAAFLTGQVACQGVRKLDRIETLADVEFRVTSQWGEDGIIEWLVHKLPSISRTLVEFGVENYGEANTRFLLQNRGWRGLVMDGSAAHMAHLRSESIYWMHDIVAECAFISAENINDLMRKHGFVGEIGILSIDIDGNDYWVLQAIDCANPAILICEINGVFGDLRAITIPYDPKFSRLEAHHSGQYFGASIRAIVELATTKGYTFVGTNTNGVNAFFVRSDLAAPILQSIVKIKAWPARHRDSRDAAGQLTFARGAARLELVKKMPVYDAESRTVRSLEELMPLYSEEWLREI